MSPPAEEVSELLRALRAAAASGAGVSLPPASYTSEAWLAVERERLFRREWICVGRADEIPLPGDYVAVEVDTVPLIVVRQPGGQILALANVCLHRMATLVTGRGRARGFSCPYHGWSYDLEGALIRAPRMPGDVCGDARHLRRAQVEQLAGFVYVSLHPAPAPLAPRVAALWQELAPYHVERMRTIRHRQHVWNTNWKVLTENFLEAYHLNVTHPDTLAPLAPARNVDMRPGGEAFQVYAHRMAESVAPVPLDPEIGIGNDELTPEQRQTAYIGGVFPSHVFSVTWDWVFWLSLQPRGVGQVVVDWGIAAPLCWPAGEPDPSHPNLYFLDLVDRVNAEDRLRVEAVQRGAASGWGAQSPLHPHEATLTGFARYLAAQCGAGDGPETAGSATLR